MRSKNTTLPRSRQAIDFDDFIPVDLHGERMLIAAALRYGGSAPLADITPAHFYCEWHKVIAGAILKFPAKRFRVSELEATLPAFVRPYLAALLRYQLLVDLGEQRTN